MPLQDYMKLISVDDHVIEHPQVWEDRLPARYREAGPRVVSLQDGFTGAVTIGELALKPGDQVWQYEGRMYPQLGINAVAGKDPREWGRDPCRYEEMLPGAYQPKARVADMDADGIQAMLLFPSFPRFAGTVFLQGSDQQLANLCVQAWNDFILEEWCGYAPDRFIPMTLIPLWDVDLAVKEIERTVAKGTKCLAFPENPVPLGLPSWSSGHWDPVCAAAQEYELPLCMHFATSGSVPQPAPDSNFLTVVSLLWVNSVLTASELLFSPVLYNFPRLKLALSEGGIGWIPFLLERTELSYERHRFYNKVYGDLRPTELFRRHIYGCFIVDETGIAARHQIGVDNIMWECDYPHSDSHWPHARLKAAEQLADVPDEEVHKIVELNARRLFHFDADLTQ